MAADDLTTGRMGARRHRLAPAVLCAAALVAAAPVALAAQAAVDPAMVPRALTLAREGRRADATAMLGRYLATAPADGRAWLTLGRFYLLDTRDWHLTDHGADTDGGLLVDLSGSVLDQAIQLGLDSARFFRGMVEVERAILQVEQLGWNDARAKGSAGFHVPLPNFVTELGYNLLNSCPQNGILATGNEVEALAVWTVALGVGWRRDVQPLIPSLYAVDPRYRKRMAQALDVDESLSVQQALQRVAEKRPICLSPMADRAAAPLGIWTPHRLVLVSGAPQKREPGGVLSVTALIEAQRAGPAAWTAEVWTIYAAAARHNVLLCAGLLAPTGESAEGCRK
jgi:hypothetical protein